MEGEPRARWYSSHPVRSLRFVGGVGGHNDKHGASILPDTLRWLWRDYKLTGK